jgi:predicted nucleic acid-binding protein
VILDTNAVSALFAGQERLAEQLGASLRHHLPVIVVGEYRYGLERSSKRALLGGLLQTLIEESIVLPVDNATAEHYAVVREQLRRDGSPIPENDVWIAALASQHGLPVVSRDRHFEHVEGLRLITW